MTYQVLNLSQIKISEDRQRRDYGDIEDLANSIKEMGLLQPLGVEEETMQLVWGGRRYKALLSLGEEAADCRLVPKGCSSLELEAIELEENIRRKDLTPAEECKAYQRIDLLKKSLLGDAEETRSRSSWSTRKTALLLGAAPSGVAEKIKLAEAMEILPELEACSTIDDMKKALKSKIDDVLVKEIVKTGLESGSARFKFADSHYTVGDFFERVDEVEAEPYLAIVDTPYAIDLHDSKKVNKATSNLEDYTEWTKESYIPKCSKVAQILNQKLARNAWILWWFGIEWYKELYEVLMQAGLQVDNIPAIWFKTNASGQSKQPSTNLGRVYETFFVCRKGDPALAQRGRPNLFMHKVVPAARKIHTTEKPLGLMIEIFKIFTFPGTIFMVPFLGSGVDLRAGYALGRSGFGYDLSSSTKDKFLLQVNKDIEEGRYEHASNNST